MTQTNPPTPGNNKEYSRKKRRGGGGIWILRFGCVMDGLKIRIKGKVPSGSPTPKLKKEDWRTKWAAPDNLPVVNVEEEQFVTTLASVDIDAYIFSLDPEEMTFLWVQDSGTPVALDDETAESPTFVAPEESTTLVFTVTVEDSEGLIQVTVTIEVAGAV